MKNIKNLVGSLLTSKNIFLFALLALFFLLFRNPFSTRTLIPNMEPYPDVLHYVSPARSLASGGPFRLVRSWGSIEPAVSPLYSLYLVPFYFINSDARMYYFANVLLSFFSLFLFYKILKKLTDNLFIVAFSLMIFAGNYFLYWYPTWAMAENMIIPLFLGGAYLLFLKPDNKKVFLASFVTIGFYATKYAFAPLSFFYLIFYGAKLLKSKNKNLILRLIFWLFLLGLPLFLYGYIVQGVDPTGGIVRQFFSLGSSGKTNFTKETEPWFSKVYFPGNFDSYINQTKGYVRRFLWEFKPLYERWIFSLGSFGIFWSFLDKKLRRIGLFLFLMSMGQILFISTFYSADGRYIYMIIPTMLLGVSLFLVKALSFLEKKKLSKYFYLFLFGLFGLFIFQNALRLKNQVVLNLRYQETPWSYISVLSLNDYFSEKRKEKPIVISPLPPFYIDYFSNDNYDLLPLAYDQDFRVRRELVWGPGDYSNLISLYEEKLKSGRTLFLSTYGVGNVSYMKEAVDNIFKNFETKEVKSDCFDLCKIYEITLER